MKSVVALGILGSIGTAILLSPIAAEVINWNMSNARFAKMCKNEDRVLVFDRKVWDEWYKYISILDIENKQRHEKSLSIYDNNKRWNAQGAIYNDYRSKRDAYTIPRNFDSVLIVGRPYGWPYAGIWKKRYILTSNGRLVAQYDDLESGTFFIPWYFPGVDYAGLDRRCFKDRKYPNTTFSAFAITGSKNRPIRWQDVKK